MRARESKNAANRRGKHVHAERRPQNIVDARRGVANGKRAPRQIGEDGVANAPVERRVNEMSFSAQNQNRAGQGDAESEPRQVDGRVEQAALGVRRAPGDQREAADAAGEHKERRYRPQAAGEQRRRQKHQGRDEYENGAVGEREGPASRFARRGSGHQGHAWPPKTKRRLSR